ncbi:MAG: alpha/beta hydrolase [Acuticoccus sp.]
MNTATRAFWNTQFQMSAFLPDADDWPPRYAALSAAATARHGAPQRIATGPEPMQALWRIRSGRPSHAMIFIHGGYWRRYAAADYMYAVEAAAAADATFYSVDYRLMPGVRMADLVADCEAACRAALAEVTRAVIVGHSAGGHLTAEMARRLSGPVAAALPVSGLFALDPLRGSFLQDEIALTAEEVAEFSPLEAAGDIAVPVDLFVGADETVEFHRQSARLCDALHEAGTPATFTELPGHHLAVIAELANPESPLTRRIAHHLL